MTRLAPAATQRATACSIVGSASSMWATSTSGRLVTRLRHGSGGNLGGCLSGCLGCAKVRAAASLWTLACESAAATACLCDAGA